MVNKPLIRPYFWGGYVARGGWLNSHEFMSCSNDTEVVIDQKCEARIEMLSEEGFLSSARRMMTGS